MARLELIDATVAGGDSSGLVGKGEPLEISGVEAIIRRLRRGR